MTIYHAISFYQTLVCVTHSCINSDDKKILLFSSSIQTSINTSALEKLFDKVIYINIRAGLEDINTYKKEVVNYFDELFEKNDICLDSETLIYSGGSHYNFGIYLALKNISFYYMEEACGLLSNPEHVRGIDRNNRKEVDIVDEYGLYDGTCKSVLGIVCNINEQVIGYQNEKMIHFDVSVELMKLNDFNKKQIMEVFGSTEQYSIPDNSVVVLSQHYANLNMMSYEEQALLYGLVFDYFLSDKKIIVKRHPADHMGYKAIYPEIEVVNKQFLSEFIPTVMKPIPSMIATISSTGIKPLKNVIQESFQLDFEFETVFKKIHRVYFALTYIAMLKNIKSVTYMNLNKSMLVALCKYSCSSLENIELREATSFNDILPNSILIIDELPRGISMDNRERIAMYFCEECPAKAIIFINSKEDFLFHKALDETVWNNVIPIVLQKKNLDKLRDYTIYDDFNNETIYLYTKDKRMRHMAQNFSHKRELKHLRLSVNTEGYDSESKLKIEVLQGMLNATEQRLLYYMELCKAEENGDE